MAIDKELCDIVSYIHFTATAGAEKVGSSSSQGLAKHILNDISERASRALAILKKENISERTQRENFLKRQLQLDLTEAAGDAGDSGQSE